METKQLRVLEKYKKNVIYEVLHELFVKNRTLTLMLLPCILFVFVFSYIPMSGIIIAFKNYSYTKGIFGSDWVGINNFKFFFITGAAMRVTFNTVTYNLAFMLSNLVFQMSVAVLLTEIRNKYFKKISQSLILLPFFVSWVVVGAMVFNLFNTDSGYLNSILLGFGLNSVDVMNTPIYWPIIFVIFNIWKGLGYGSVIYLSAIAGIDQEMYEAAKVDGASALKRIFKITLPCLKPTAVTLILLGLGNIVKGDFGMFYNLTGNNPLLLEVTDIVDTFVFRSLMQTQDFGMSAAAGIYQSVIGFAVVLSVNSIIKKMQPEYALF